MRRYCAFTLIELLVVVTIIVVLLAMLTPSLESAVLAAQKAKCASNLHSIHLGTNQYAMSNQGELIICRGRQVQTCFDTANPKTPHGGSTPDDLKVDWLAALASVGLAESGKTTMDDGTLQNRPIEPLWQCPVSAVPQVKWTGAFGQYEVGYSYMGGIGRSQWVHSTTGVAYPQPPSPQKLGQSSPGWMLASDNTYYAEGKWDPAHLNHTRPGNKGPDGSTQAFMDGSAQWIEREKLSVGHTFWATHFISFFYQTELPTGWTVTDADRPDAFN